MLTRLAVRRFKSLRSVDLRLPRLCVLFGPNSAGKSNILDALQALSRVTTLRTLNDALADPQGGGHLIRGFPIEAFAFPPAGLAGLLQGSLETFELEAELRVRTERYRYRIEVGIQPTSGALSTRDEYLSTLDSSGHPKGQPRIERVGSDLVLRARAHPGRPRHEKLALNYSLISDPRLGGAEHRVIETCRQEFAAWRTYYLDPRVAMRTAKPPAAVEDIGVLGEDIAPFLYRLQAEQPRAFTALSRTVRAIIPSVEQVAVELDLKRGTIDVTVREDGIDLPSRIVSEGTLRVIALASIAVNPWHGSLVAFEEPENGVHPRRVELIAELLASLVDRTSVQLVITTHSPLFCKAILRKARAQPNDIGLFRVNRDSLGTRISQFPTTGPLFDDPEIQQALADHAEGDIFEEVEMRNLIDA